MMLLLPVLVLMMIRQGRRQRLHINHMPTLSAVTTALAAIVPAQSLPPLPLMSDRLAWSGKCNSVSLSTPTQVKCQSDLATSNSYFLSRFVLLPILFILIALLLTASSSFCTANGQFWFWKLKVAVDFVLQQQSKAKHHQGQPICHHPRWLLYKCRVVGQSKLWSTNGAEFNDQRAIEGKNQRGTRRENVTECSKEKTTHTSTITQSLSIESLTEGFCHHCR